MYSLYDNKKLAQQFMFGVGYGLGGFVGALSAGATYGKYLFLYSAIFALFLSSSLCAILSASIVRKPWSFSKLQTVLFPVAIPPVKAIACLNKSLLIVDILLQKWFI